MQAEKSSRKARFPLALAGDVKFTPNISASSLTSITVLLYSPHAPDLFRGWHVKNWLFHIAFVSFLIGASACAATPTLAPAAPPTQPPVVPRERRVATPTEFQATNTAPPTVNRAIPPAPIATPTLVPAAPTITPPPPNPAYPLLTVHLEAVAVSDDDGRRAVRITPQQVKQWVDKANEIFAQASVRFVFDSDLDFVTFESTTLNDMTGDSDTNWKREVDTGNRVAADHAGKLVVFFIHGPEQGATGGGFSASNYNFVEMPGFNDTTVCGYQNIGILAHEVGHYLGLAHPFAVAFRSSQEAEAYLSAHGNDPTVFDGDGLSDTPPDPFISTPQFQCNPGESITLNGRKFLLPRKNIMSYYSTSGFDRTDLTAQQSAIVRWVMNVRAKNGMATPTNLNVPGSTEFAALPVKDKVNVSPGVQDMSGFGDTPRWSGDKQLFTGAQPNSMIGFSFSASKAGKYTLSLYATTAPDFGKIQTLVDGNPHGEAIDLYAPIVLPSGKITVGTIDLSAGSHTLGFRVVGKNAASNGYSLGLNAYTLTVGQ
jgi:hypothetical protein